MVSVVQTGGPGFDTYSVVCMPTVGWHIAVQLSISPSVHLSVSQSVRPSENFNIVQNFCNIEDSILIFVMHAYLMELHILSGKRSRSSFKGQRSNIWLQSGAVGGIVFLTNKSLLFSTFWEWGWVPLNVEKL